MNWFDNLFYLKSRTWILLFKFYPIVYNLWLLVGMIMCLTDKVYHDYGFIFIGGCFAFSLLSWKWSVDLHFCKWHRILILNQMIYLFFQLLSELNTEFNYYIYMALIFNVLAIIVATILYVRYGCYKRMENHTSAKHNNFRREERTDEVSKRAAADRVS